MKQYYQQAREIISDVASSNRSCVLMGSSGSGKSITAKNYFASLPKTAATYAVIAKEEYMDERCVSCAIYDHRSPKASVSVIENVAAILSDRLNGELWRNLDYSPVRLILRDWGHLATDLQSNHPALWSDAVERLNRIQMIGTRFNIAIFADINVPNLTYVGAYSLHAGTKIIAQGGFGDYSLISHALNKFYSDSDQKPILESTKEELAILLEKTNDPIICQINSDSATFGIIEPQA